MKLNVAVIFGGRSVEHEVSIISAVQCINALDKDKYNAVPIYITKQGIWYTGDKLNKVENYCDVDKLLPQCDKIVISQNSDVGEIYRAKPAMFGSKLLTKIDVAFPVAHGTHGEDGVLQGFLELMNIPYVGCDVLSSAITMDKIVAQTLLRALNIPVLDSVWFYANEWLEDKEKILAQILRYPYPLIVKPANLGSSIGVSSVNNQTELEDAIELAISMSQRILIEPKVENLREINCAVLGDHELAEVSVCEEPIKGEAILSYQDKYCGNDKHAPRAGMSGAKRKVPADITENKAQAIQELAKKAFWGLNCSGVARIDFLLDQNTDQIYLCEVNTIPGSLSFYLWEPLGKSFTELTSRLIELALKKQRDKNNLVLSYNTNILRNFSGAKGIKQ